MEKIIIIAAAILALVSCGQKAAEPTEVTMSKAELLDKIKGGWAGQTIGVVYGAPTEFKFRGTTIQDYQTIPWGDGYVMYWWHKKPGLFDDIYNDLTAHRTHSHSVLHMLTTTLLTQTRLVATTSAAVSCRQSPVTGSTTHTLTTSTSRSKLTSSVSWLLLCFLKQFVSLTRLVIS